MRVTTLILGVVLALSWTAKAGAAAPPEASADEQTLSAAGLPPDGASLLSFFRTRTSPDVAPDKLMALVRQLGDADIKVRTRAATELISHGTAAVPHLRHAINDLENADVAASAQAASKSSTDRVRARCQRRPLVSWPCANPPAPPRCCWLTCPSARTRPLSTKSATRWPPWPSATASPIRRCSRRFTTRCRSPGPRRHSLV